MESYDGPTSVVSLRPSTTWEWRKVMIKAAAPRRDTGFAKQISSRFFPARDPHRTLDVKMRFRGGPEACYDVSCRGRTWRFPGYTAMIDVIMFVNGQAAGDALPR